jgi:hypothetical protein
VAVQSVLGPGGYSKAPYASFAGKTPAVGGAVVIPPIVALLKARGFMAIRNQALTVNFLAWDTNANTGKTGDSANFTLRLIADGGIPAVPTNAISEPDSTNMPGTYELALTAGEMNADFVTLHGISSTSNIVIFPLFITTESGDLAAIDSQLTVTDGVVDTIASDTVVIESSVQAVEGWGDPSTPLSDIESSLVIVKSDLVVVESSVQAVEAWGDPSSDLAAIESELIQVHSETTAIQAWGDPSTPLSDIESSLVIVKSDLVQIYSDTTAIEASGGLSVAQDSKLTKVTSDVVIVGSDLLQVYSDTTIISSQTTVIESDSIVIESSVQAVESELILVHSETTRIDLGIITGSAQTGTLSTTQATTDLTGYADDQLIGRILVVTSGNADGEATDITDYANASGLLTFTALTTAMANGDTFKIV